jgi:hypothetical protein
MTHVDNHERELSGAARSQATEETAVHETAFQLQAKGIRNFHFLLGLEMVGQYAKCSAANTIAAGLSQRTIAIDNR